MTDPGETKKIRLRMSREHEVTEPIADKKLRDQLTRVDDMAIVIKRILREGRGPTTTEAMQIARVLGGCFPSLYENHLLFSAFVNALPVKFIEDEPREF